MCLTISIVLVKNVLALDRPGSSASSRPSRRWLGSLAISYSIGCVPLLNSDLRSTFRHRLSVLVLMNLLAMEELAYVGDFGPRNERL